MVIGARRSLKPRTHGHASRVAPGTPMGAVRTVSIKNRTGLRHAETEIGKQQAETGARQPNQRNAIKDSINILSDIHNASCYRCSITITATPDGPHLFSYPTNPAVLREPEARAPRLSCSRKTNL